MSFWTIFNFLTSEELPAKIKALGEAIASILIALAFAISAIIGAWSFLGYVLSK